MNTYQAHMDDKTFPPHTHDAPKHYDNSNGSLYKIATDLNLNAYQFDILKRVVRAEKKGEFESDIDKTIHVLKLWKEESKK